MDTDGATVLAVPIKLREQVVAVLNVRSGQEQEFTSDDLEMVQAIAERVALPAQNARLLQETSSRAVRERTLAEATNKIRASDDPQAMIETAMREFKDALGASQIEVLHTNGTRGKIQAGDSAS